MSPVPRALSHETPPCGSRRTALAEIRKSTPCKANCCKTPCDHFLRRLSLPASTLTSLSPSLVNSSVTVRHLSCWPLAQRSGVNLLKICDQTGHKSLEMLRVYCRDAELFVGNAA